MKKLKILVIFLFAIFFVSGCSCTQSMCEDSDLEAIKASIKEKIEGDSEYVKKLRDEAILADKTTEEDIQAYVNEKINEKVESEYEDHPKACMTTVDMEDPTSGATISKKTWKSSFEKGLLEGLIVYPISWLLITFTSLFGGNGGGQILSIIITTLIIRLFMLLITFSSQVQNQKMQMIQVEINDISQKLKDPNLSQSEKSKLSMKMLEIYKKNGINPLSSLVPTLLSFPIFLSVWSAVSQTLVIRTGTFAGVNLGSAVSTQVFKFNIGAIILFILMSAAQILSIKIPNIIRLKKASYKDKEKVKEANKQSSTMMNIMLVMILFTGFVLPSALAVYWTIGALFSVAQTCIFQSDKVKEKLSAIGNRKNKAKVIQ